MTGVWAYLGDRLVTVAALLSRLAGGFSGCSFLGLTWIYERSEGLGSKPLFSATCIVLICVCIVVCQYSGLIDGRWLNDRLDQL